MEPQDQKKLVLVVDDEYPVRKQVVELLEKTGFRTVSAVDGKDALAKIAEELPDLIISDINMPVMNGWEFCKRVRENPATRDIAFIMLTIRKDEQDRVHALGVLGADEYVTKPVVWRDLRTTIDYLLKYVREFPGVHMPPSPGSTGSGTVAAAPSIRQPSAVKSAVNSAAASNPATVSAPTGPDTDVQRDIERGIQAFNGQNFRLAAQLFSRALTRKPGDAKLTQYRDSALKNHASVLFRRPGATKLIPQRLYELTEDIVKLNLSSEETYVYSIINGESSIRQIVAESGLGHRKTMELLIKLVSIGAIDLFDETGTPQ